MYFLPSEIINFDIQILSISKMITTKNIKLNHKQYFKILLQLYLKRKWWQIVLLWAMSILFFVKDNPDKVDYAFIIFAIIYPISLPIQFWRHAKTKENKIFLLERYYEIDTEKIVGVLKDNSKSPIKLEHFIKVVIVNKTFVLYLSKNQFINIPFNAFQNSTDLDYFKTEIISKIK